MLMFLNKKFIGQIVAAFAYGLSRVGAKSVFQFASSGRSEQVI